MARVTVVMNRPAVDEFRGWNGPVGRAVNKLAQGMALGQRVVAPKRTGRLAASIKVGNKAHWARGIEVKVGANPPVGNGDRRGYSYMQNEGTRPHVIRPRNPNGYLVFYWAKVGRVVHMKKVNHPGHVGTHWAERGAEAAMRSWDRLYV